MNDFDTVDFFTSGGAVAQDPYPFFEYLRAKGPVYREPQRGVVVVTGYQEAIALFDDHRNFSSCNGVTGPFPGLPFEPEGDDISGQIEQYRDQMACNEFLVTQDRPSHTAGRALLMRLFTPARLKTVEGMMVRLSDQLIDELCRRRSCELVSDYAHPFATLVIADLIGVPSADRDMFRKTLSRQWEECSDRNKSLLNRETLKQPLEFLKDQFSLYLEERRQRPRQDILTELINTRLPDGTTAGTAELLKVATFLFAAGQDTSSVLIASALKYLGENPELQQRLRDDRDLIPKFIDEVLRLESPVKSVFRLSRVPAMVGDLKVPAGTAVMILPGAANRDPRRFPEPDKLLLDRPLGYEHLSFGHGIHTCAGRYLARAETRVTIERMLDRLAEIKISTGRHGLPGAYSYEYDSTYILRKLNSLYLEFSQVPPQNLESKAS